MRCHHMQQQSQENITVACTECRDGPCVYDPLLQGRTVRKVKPTTVHLPPNATYYYHWTRYSCMYICKYVWVPLPHVHLHNKHAEKHMQLPHSTVLLPNSFTRYRCTPQHKMQCKCMLTIPNQQGRHSTNNKLPSMTMHHSLANRQPIAMPFQADQADVMHLQAKGGS